MDPQNTPTINNKQTNNPLAFVAIVVIVLLVIFGIIGYINFNKQKSAPKDSSSQQSDVPPQEQASVYLDPAQASFKVNDTITLSLIVNTNDQPVNSIQAELNYPTELLDFVNIDDSESSFDTSVVKTGKDGKISIIRGQISGKGVVGNKQVAKINFKAKNKGRADITFDNKTMIVRADENSSRITGDTAGATLNIN